MEFEKDQIVFLFHIDQTVKTGSINQLKTELRKAGIYRISYAVIPKDRKYDQGYYQYLAFHLPNQNWDFPLDGLKDIGREINSFSNIIEIKLSIDGITLNDSLVTSAVIKDKIKQKIKANPDFVILYHPMDEHMPFSEYFSVLSGAHEAVDEIKNEYSQDKYGKAYKELDYEQEIQVKEALPFNLVELTPQLLQAIKSEKGNKTRTARGE